MTISYDEKWILKDANSKASAISGAPEVSYALGKHTWLVHNDQCQNGSYKAELKLTGCAEEEFTCNDGQCVSMRQRCDQVPNCKDFSDERGCQLVLLNEGYNQKVPPFKMESYIGNRMSPVRVNVSLKLLNVMRIDEVENTIDLKFHILLEWFDHRLTYNNLKHRRYLNALNETDVEMIWLPLVIYENTEQMESTRLGLRNEWSTSVMIVREGNFTR